MESIDKSNSYYTKREVDRLIENLIIVMGGSIPKTHFEKLTKKVSLQEKEISNLKERISNLKERIKILEEKK